MFTLRCFYCKSSQDTIPANILAMYDEAKPTHKSKIISELFEKTGKSRTGKELWVMNDKKPFFQQALT